MSTRASVTLAFFALLDLAGAAAQQVTFKSDSNLVLVPVVVRDRSGNAVGNLHKEDFQLYNDGAEQAISSFTVEETSGRAAQDRSLDGAKAAPLAMPEHFAALVFDDAHLQDFDDIVYTRRAVVKYLDTLQPADRVALFTASGQYDVDFTTDRAKLQAALMKVTPGPPPFFFGMPGEQIARSVIAQCGRIVHRMSLLPGQRTMVFIGSGLPIRGPDPVLGPEWDCVPETMRLIDQAIHARVVIGSLDSRGLALQRPTTRPWEFQLRVTDGTGGKFVRDSNDLEGAVKELAATPQYIYLLGFAPQTTEAGNRFHKLQVKLRNGRKLDLQARAGYWDVGALSAPVIAAEPEKLRVSQAETDRMVQALNLGSTPPPAPAAKNDEMITTDQPVTFKVQSNLVEVPVVVRDRAGHAVGDLRQQDFRIMDKGKRQEIAKFAIVKSATAAVPAGESKVGTPALPALAAAPPLPDRFIAFVFDDVNIRFEDLPQVRSAVLKYIQTSLGPQDRIALFTTSGRHGADFTNRPEELSAPLLKISPSPVRSPELSGCGAYVSYFQAVMVDQQVGLQPTQSDTSKSLALRVAVAEFGDFHIAVQEIRDSYNSGLQESRTVLATLRLAIQRLTAMPGQRSIVLVSPGFYVPPELQDQSSEVMAFAVRSKVLIGTIGARGVWINPVFGACQRGGSAASMQDETAFRDLEGQANTDELIALAEGTGGTVNLDNDFAGGVRRAAAAPEYLYVIGFVPQALKLDGAFHALKVTLNSGDRFSLQARRGYWAPKHAEDEASISKQEIQDAVFSRDEIHSLPVDMHTQVAKSGDQNRLNVLTSVDLKALHLRRDGDRNRNDLTIVAALFDLNGNFMAGTQKLLELRLRDETVGKIQQRPPVTITTDFEVKPGAYLVRMVVRDDEARQITAENAAVQVP